MLYKTLLQLFETVDTLRRKVDSGRVSEVSVSHTLSHHVMLSIATEPYLTGNGKMAMASTTYW